MLLPERHYRDRSMVGFIWIALCVILAIFAVTAVYSGVMDMLEGIELAMECLGNESRLGQP